MGKEQPQHFEPNQTINQLIEHIKIKLETLDKAALAWGLSEEATQQLKKHLKEEKTLYLSLPPDTTVAEAMDLHEKKTQEGNDLLRKNVNDSHPRKGII